MMIIVKNYRNCLLYRNLIERGQRNKLMQRNRYFYLDVQEVRHYVFMSSCFYERKLSYFLRFTLLGALSEEDIVGKFILI